MVSHSHAHTLQQDGSNRINAPIEWNAACLFTSPALPPGNSGGWRPVTWHLIIQGRWKIKLGRVDDIFLRLSYPSWLLFIFLCDPPHTHTRALGNVSIYRQSLHLVFKSVSGTMQDLKKRKTRYSLTALLPHPLSSGAKCILTHQRGKKNHFPTDRIKEGTLRKLVRSRQFNNQTCSHLRYN